MDSSRTHQRGARQASSHFLSFSLHFLVVIVGFLLCYVMECTPTGNQVALPSFPSNVLFSLRFLVVVLCFFFFSFVLPSCVESYMVAPHLAPHASRRHDKNKLRGVTKDGVEGRGGGQKKKKRSEQGRVSTVQKWSCKHCYSECPLKKREKERKTMKRCQLLRRPKTTEIETCAPHS
jgi:hypothetical protein